jgi:hypothetical protein
MPESSGSTIVLNARREPQHDAGERDERNGHPAARRQLPDAVHHQQALLEHEPRHHRELPWRAGRLYRPDLKPVELDQRRLLRRRPGAADQERDRHRSLLVHWHQDRLRHPRRDRRRQDQQHGDTDRHHLRRSGNVDRERCTGTPADGTRSSDVQVWNSTISNWEAGSGGGAQTGHSHGIYTGQLDNGVIANNVFYNDTNTAIGWGIQLGGSATKTLVVNNTFDRIKVPSGSGGFGGGIVVWGASSYGPLPSGNRIENNLFTNLSEWGVTSSGSAASPLSNYVLNNDAYNNGAGQYQPLYGTNRVFYCTAAGTTACPGDNYAPFDPLYANGAGHDYHLQSGSPARGKGDPAYTPAVDKDGNARSAPPRSDGSEACRVVGTSSQLSCLAR